MSTVFIENVYHLLAKERDIERETRGVLTYVRKFWRKLVVHVGLMHCVDEAELSNAQI